MPSPIGHALGGLIVGLALLPSSGADRSVRTPGARARDTSGALRAVVLAACLPDLDFLWGRHNMETHSVVVALFVGLAVWVGSRGRARRVAIACALAWASHVLFDWLGSDDSPPLGVMALWPFNSRFYFADAYIFEAISRRYREPGFWDQNIWAVVKEILMLGPLAVGLLYWRNATARMHQQP